MMKKCFLVYVVLCSIHSLCNAKTQIITIDKGVVSKVPIAIHKILGENSALSDEISKVISNDLEKSGLIRIVDYRAYTNFLKSFDDKPRHTEWKSIGAHFLVVLSLRGDGSGGVVELKIYDTIVGRMLDHYKISAKNARSLAHSVSNKIYGRITGEEGYFNSKVVFVKEKSAERTGIAVMDIDGQNEINLISGNNIYLSPRFSPNGKNIVYFSYKQGYSKSRHRRKALVGEVYIMDLASGNRKTLVIPGNLYMSYAPRFSPDGKRLVFSLSNKRGGSAIYSYELNSHGLRRLTNPIGTTIDTSPCYSQDGRKIVFNSDVSGAQQIYVMDADGGNVRRLSFGSGRYATPVWSPRGDYIAFSRITEGEFYIGVMRTDGSGERMIASGYVVENPSWVSNGRLIMFTKKSYRGSEYAINAVDVTGHYEGTVKSLASDPDINGNVN